MIRRLLAKSASPTPGSRRVLRRSASGTRAVTSRCAALCCCDCCWFGDYCQNLQAVAFPFLDPESGTPLVPTGWAPFHNAGRRGKFHFGFEIDSICDFLQPDGGPGSLRTGTVRLATLRPGTTQETGDYAFDYGFTSEADFGLPVVTDRCNGRLAVGDFTGDPYVPWLPWGALTAGQSTRYDWVIRSGEQTALERLAHRWQSPYGQASTEPPDFGYTRHPLITDLLFDAGGAAPFIGEVLGAMGGPFNTAGCPGFGLKHAAFLKRLFEQYLAPFPGFSPIGDPDPSGFLAWLPVWPDGGTTNQTVWWEMWRALLTAGSWVVTDTPAPGFSGFEIEVSNGSDFHPEVGRIELDVAWRRIGEGAAAFPFQGEARIRATMRLEVLDRCDALPVLPDGWACGVSDVPRVIAVACDGSGETIVIQGGVGQPGGGAVPVEVTLPGGEVVTAHRCYTQTSEGTDEPLTPGVVPVAGGCGVAVVCDAPWVRIIACRGGAQWWVRAIDIADRPAGVTLGIFDTDKFTGCAEVTGEWTGQGSPAGRAVVNSVAWGPANAGCEHAVCSAQTRWRAVPCAPPPQGIPGYQEMIAAIAASPLGYAVALAPETLLPTERVIRGRYGPTQTVACFLLEPTDQGDEPDVTTLAYYLNCIRCNPPGPDPPITDPVTGDPIGFNRVGEAGGEPFGFGGRDPNARAIERHMLAGVPCAGCGG